MLPDSPTLSFALVSQASKGVATIDVTGAFTYMPDVGTRGTDSFTYRVDDLDGGTDTATATVIIGDTRIMPLGDSITTAMITSGSPPPALRVGYRKPLYGLLVSGGYSFDFVGGDVFGTDASLSPFAPDNAGHGGFTASDIVFGGSASGYPVDGVRSWLEQNPADIVLLHIGTNDFFSTTAGDVALILDEIDDWEGSAVGNPVTVLLARIIDRDPFVGDVTSFSDAVEAMAIMRISIGDKIIIDVDQENALVYPPTMPNDMGDNLHPNETRYGKMADIWLNALTSVLPKCP